MTRDEAARLADQLGALTEAGAHSRPIDDASRIVREYERGAGGPAVLAAARAVQQLVALRWSDRQRPPDFDDNVQASMLALLATIDAATWS